MQPAAERLGDDPRQDSLQRVQGAFGEALVAVLLGIPATASPLAEVFQPVDVPETPNNLPGEVKCCSPSKADGHLEFDLTPYYPQWVAVVICPTGWRPASIDDYRGLSPAQVSVRGLATVDLWRQAEAGGYPPARWPQGEASARWRWLPPHEAPLQGGKFMLVPGKWIMRWRCPAAALERLESLEAVRSRLLAEGVHGPFSAIAMKAAQGPGVQPHRPPFTLQEVEASHAAWAALVWAALIGEVG